MSNGRPTGNEGNQDTEGNDWELIVDGIDVGEGPRWHLGRLWFSDFHQATISSVGHDRQRRIEVRWEGRPSGLGWLPDGRLLFVSMLDRRVMRREADGTIVEHADLPPLTPTKTEKSRDSCAERKDRGTFRGL